MNKNGFLLQGLQRIGKMDFCYRGYYGFKKKTIGFLLEAAMDKKKQLDLCI